MIPFFDSLDDSAVEAIHTAALDILERMGVMIDHPGALGRLADAGAAVGMDQKVARLSVDMVATALERVPARIVCAGRTPGDDVVQEDAQQRRPLLRAPTGCIARFDAVAGTHRPLQRRDGITAARLVDALPNVDMTGTLTLTDIPQATYDVHAFRDTLVNCRKHIWALTIDSRNLVYQLRMAEAVAGSRADLARRPLCSGIFSMVAPMFVPADEIERLELYGAHGIPVRGASSPVTVAGTLAAINAQFLGALVIQQTLCPGLPTWYYAGAKSMDLRTAETVPNLSPENMHVCAGVARLARHYGVPSEMSLLSVPGFQMHQYMFQLGACMAWAVAAGLGGVGSAGNFDGSNAWCPDGHGPGRRGHGVLPAPAGRLCRNRRDAGRGPHRAGGPPRPFSGRRPHPGFRAPRTGFRARVDDLAGL